MSGSTVEFRVTSVAKTFEPECATFFWKAPKKAPKIKKILLTFFFLEKIFLLTFFLKRYFALKKRPKGEKSARPLLKSAHFAQLRNVLATLFTSIKTNL